MSVPTLLVALYPPAVRQRWGDELAREITGSGPRSWPDTVRGAVRLWLRPGDWPETSTGQTRRVLAVALFALAAVAALLLRAAEPTTSLTADPRHPVTSLWLLPVLAGLALAAPLPRPAALRDPRTLRRSAATAARTLAAPAAAVLGLLATAHSGLLGGPGGAFQVLVVVWYWATLGLLSLRLCALVARLARIRGLLAVPGIRRLRLALLLAGAGLTVACGQSLAGALRAGTTALLLAAALAVPTVAALAAGHNLRRHWPGS